MNFWINHYPRKTQCTSKYHEFSSKWAGPCRTLTIGRGSGRLLAGLSLLYLVNFWKCWKLKSFCPAWCLKNKECLKIPKKVFMLTRKNLKIFCKIKWIFLLLCVSPFFSQNKFVSRKKYQNNSQIISLNLKTFWWQQCSLNLNLKWTL